MEEVYVKMLLVAQNRVIFQCFLKEKLKQKQPKIVWLFQTLCSGASAFDPKTTDIHEFRFSLVTCRLLILSFA